MKRLLLLLLIAPCWAQYPGAQPTVQQSYIGGALGEADGVITFPNNPTNGNLETVCVNSQDTGPHTYGISSSRVSSWSNTTPIFVSGAPGRTTIMYWGVVSGSGTETITITGMGGPGIGGHDLSAAEIANISSTTDGSDSQSASGTPASLSNSITTTVNGDIIISCGGSNGTDGLQATGAMEYISIGSVNSATQGQTLTRTGALGSYTTTFNNQCSSNCPGGSSTLTMQSVAFKPNALAVTTTVLPRTDKVQTYNACLAAIGGTGSYSWSVTVGSLPTGISLSGGCLTGTASGSTSTFTVQAHDSGTGGNATQSLTLTVDTTAYSTPSVVQSTANQGTTNTALPFPVLNGDTLLVCSSGFNTHGSMGWIPPVGGTSNNVADTLGSTWRRVCHQSGWAAAANVCYAAKTIAGGYDTITFNSTAAGSNLRTVALELNGAQEIPDCDNYIWDSQKSSSPYNESTTYTTPIANDLVFVFNSAGFGIDHHWSMSPSAGWNNINAGAGIAGYSMMASKAQATAASISETTAVTSTGPTLDTYGALMFGVRPGLLVASGQAQADPDPEEVW